MKRSPGAWGWWVLVVLSSLALTGFVAVELLAGPTRLWLPAPELPGAFALAGLTFVALMTAVGWLWRWLGPPQRQDPPQ